MSSSPPSSSYIALNVYAKETDEDAATLTNSDDQINHKKVYHSGEKEGSADSDDDESVFADPDGEDGALGKLLQMEGGGGGVGGGGQSPYRSRPWSRARRRWNDLPGAFSFSKATLWGGVALCSLMLFGLVAKIVNQGSDDGADAVFKALARSCNRNKWRQGLYVNCTLSMGLNNLRSEFSTCLKFAFDAGAGLVLPNIVLRDNKTLNAWATEGPGVEFARTNLYFDTDGLREDLAHWCPQMRLRDQFDETDIAIQVKDKPRVWWELRFGAGDYKRHFDELLYANDIKSWSLKKGAIVEENMRPYAVWDYRSQAADVTHAWFDLIRWAPRLLALATEVAKHPFLQEAPGYLGVHLRLEADVINGWSSFEAQTDAYAHYIDQRNETNIFLACGDRHWKKKFEERFPNHHVVDKWDLMEEGTDLHTAVTGLTFDEMAVIDYVPMSHSNMVFGIGVSSFAYLLGVDRRVNRTGHYADTLHMEIMPPGSPMVGDENTLLLPPILGEYYQFFP